MPNILEKSIYNKNNPFISRLAENTLLSKEGSIKETRHLVVDLAASGLEYTCGDSLAVFPTNRNEDVDEILAAQGATGEELVSLPRSDEQISYREALFSKISLASPTKKFLILLLEKVTCEPEKTKLQKLLDPEAAEELKSYLAERHFIDLLEEFPSARLSPQELTTLSRRLVPRLYSIASSPAKYPEEVHLIIAIVRYNTNDRDRVGVCSTYLSDRVPLNEFCVPVFMAKSHFGLPEDDNTDLIMIGPGTGIAPFRAFLQERILRKAPGRSWLFFGDQHKATDYSYGEEFDQYLAEGHLDRLSLAWSRDQDNKIYVQDKMLESGKELWDWIDKGAIFYVCGDATRMASDVDAALHSIIHEHGGISESDAQAFVKQLKKEKRYQRDVY